MIVSEIIAIRYTHFKHISSDLLFFFKQKLSSL